MTTLIVVVEASVARAHQSVALVSAGTLSDSEVRILRGGEELPQILAPICKGVQQACGGVEEVGIRFQERCVTSPKDRKEDSNRTIANCFAAFGPGDLRYATPPTVVVVMGYY